MKRLAAFLAELIGGGFVWFASFFKSKVLFGAALIGVYLALCGALFLALKALVFGLVWSVPSETFRMIFWAVWPGNGEACMTACFMADGALFLFKFKDRLLSFVAAS